MNISGYSDNNTHDGSVTISGNLQVAGSVVIGGASSQSEYLDSGDYLNSIVTPIGVAWNSLAIAPGLITGLRPVRYAKNGNIVQFYITLRGNIKASQSTAVLSVTVPGFDLFGIIPLNFATLSSTFAVGTGTLYNGFVSNLNTSNNITTIIIQYTASSNNNISSTIDFDITLTYKLTGDDVPASALVVGGGGGGGGGDVSNPMLSTLDGGGFNISNLGNLQTTSINGFEPVLTPVQNDILGNNKNLIGFNDIDAATFNNKIVVSNPMYESLNAGGFSITNADNIQVNTINGGSFLTNPLQSTLNVNFNTLNNVQQINMIGDISMVTTGNILMGQNKINNVGEINMVGDIYTDNNNIWGVNDIFTSKIFSNAVGVPIEIKEDVSMYDKTISDCAELKVTKISKSALNINTDIKFGNSIDMMANNINMFTGTIMSVGSLNMAGPINMSNKNINAVEKLYVNQLYTTNNFVITSNSPIDMKGNQISNCSLSNQGANLDVSASSLFMDGTTLDMNQNQIVNCPFFNNVTHVYNNDGLPTVLNGTYIIDGNIVSNQSSHILTGDCVFIGYGRERSSITFISPTVGAGFALSVVDYSASFINLKLSNQSIAYNFLNCSNLTKNKNLCFTNCEISNCNNSSAIQINGFDIVEFNQVLFQYNYPINQLLQVIESNNLQVSSCEFVKSYNRLIPSQYATCPLIEVFGIFQTMNINGCIISPEQKQIGLSIGNGFSSLQSIVSGNTFTTPGLTTGQFIFYTLSNHPELVIQSNSGIVNERAILSATTSGNIIYTTTTQNTYVPINFGVSFVVDTIVRFAPSLTPYAFNYVGKNPISCLVTGSFLADHSTSGFDSIFIGLFKNGVLATAIQTNLSNNTPQSVVYSAVVSLFQNDLLQFRVNNTTATGTNVSGFRCVSFNGTLVEI